MPTQRLTTTQRGYGHRHKRLRAQLAPLVRSGRATCWRCHQPITPTEPWDLGHDDHNRHIYRGPEHANRCNRSAAGHKAAGTLPTAPSTPDTTRRW